MEALAGRVLSLPYYYARIVYSHSFRSLECLQDFNSRESYNYI